VRQIITTVVVVVVGGLAMLGVQLYGEIKSWHDAHEQMRVVTMDQGNLHVRLVHSPYGGQRVVAVLDCSEWLRSERAIEGIPD
jgi:hypothetical protein